MHGLLRSGAGGRYQRRASGSHSCDEADAEDRFLNQEENIKIFLVTQTRRHGLVLLCVCILRMASGQKQSATRWQARTHSKDNSRKIQLI